MRKKTNGTRTVDKRVFSRDTSLVDVVTAVTLDAAIKEMQIWVAAGVELPELVYVEQDNQYYLIGPANDTKPRQKITGYLTTDPLYSLLKAREERRCA